MKKFLLSSLLGVFLLGFGGISMAAEYHSIHQVDVTADIPEVGEKVSNVINTLGQVGETLYGIDSVNYEKKNGDNWDELNPNDEFECNENYRVVLRLQVLDKQYDAFNNESMSAEGNIKINGETGEYLEYSGFFTKIKIGLEFTLNDSENPGVDSNIITSIGITGVVYPTVGQTVQDAYNSIQQGFSYTSNGYQVYTYNDSNDYHFDFRIWDDDYNDWFPMDINDKFTANDAYRVGIRFMPMAGYSFGCSTNECNNVIIAINGANRDESRLNSDQNAGWLMAYKDFTLSAPTQTEISEITISGITDPVLGAYPVTGGITITSTPEGVAHVVSPWWSDSYGITTCPMGVCSESWDTSYFSYQDYASTKKYYLVIPYSLDEGYVLADNATITTNGNGTVGKTTAYIEVNNQYVAYDGVKITYNASDLQGPTTISAISITGAVAPVGGTTPATNGTSIEKLLPEQGITIGTVKWYHSDGYNNRGYVLTDDTQFVAGNQYELVVEVTEDYGYDLNSYYDNPATTLTVNGENGRVQYNSKRELTKVYTATEPALNTYTVTWKNGETILETDENVVEGATPSYDGATPTKAATSSYTYSFKGWSKDGTNVVDLATETITENTIYSAIFTQKKKSGGGGGGSNGGSTTTNTGDNANIGNIANVNTGDTTNITNENKSEEKQENNAENQENTQNDSQKVLKDGLTQEFHDAYDFAHKHGITTMDNISKANMNGPLTRIAMAKMLSNYAINVLGKKPANKIVPKFPDVDEKLNEDYGGAVDLAYQLGIMGIGIEKFRPFDPVDRKEFGTALSRMLFGIADGDEVYYETHLKKLKEEGIITNDNPDLQEARGYVMIMLMRSASK